MVEHVSTKETRENLITYPFEAAVSILATLSITNVIRVTVHLKELPPSIRGGILSLPPELVWIWLISGLCGALLMLFGVCLSSFSWFGRMIESVGLWFSMGMWLSIGVVDLLRFHHDWAGYLQYLVIGLACALRLYALHRVKMAVHRAAREAQGLREERV